MLEKAAFVLLPQYADNGNFTAVDAASLGIPSVCSDYPAQKYMNEYCGIPAIYFEPFSKDSLLNAIHKMEKEYKSIKKEMPLKNELDKYDYSVQGKKLYQSIKSILKIG